MKNYKIWKKSLVFGVLALFVGMSAIPSTGITVEEKPSLPASSGNILYVGGSGPGNYSTIQAAINAANNGDTIFVYNGTYNENVKVNKTINLTGEGKDITIIYGIDELDDAVKITADLANVSEFTIKNGGINSAGIRVQADQCSISDTIIIDNQEKGLWIDNSENNTILDNALSDNSHGIYVDNSDNNMISNNNVSDNRNNGIYGVRSNNNDIVNNLVNSNDLIGIYLIQDCDNNEISNNTVKSNEKGGIRLYKSDDNIISNNAVSKNGGPTYDGGIVFYYSNNNNIFANSVNSNSNQGIFIENAINNNIFYNTVTNNNYGIRCKDSSGNIIYHNNNIGNTQNANDDGTNTWHNSTLQQGNYWNDYTGEDSDGDGIGDTPYNIPGNSNQDEYPLMTEYGPPHADFTHTIDDKNVSFDASRSYDYDGTIVSYEWDFDDNATGTGLLINHTYSEDGIYNVTLTVTDDDNKNDSTVKMVIVDSIPPEITDNTPSVGYTGDPFTFNATVTDNVQVYEVIAAYRYENGPVLNIDLNNTDGDYWEATIIIERTLEKIYYQIFAWDFSDNENHTDLKNITIMDNDLPEITDVIADPEVQMIDGYVNISAVVTDNIAVDEVYLYIRYPDSSVKNFSITGNKIGDMYYSNRAYDQAGVHTFHIWASDTSGNSNISEDNTFEIVLGVPPEIPQIRGPTEVKKDTPNPYEFSSTDPDGDDVYYWIEWGDDDTEEWIGPYGSGEVITVNHTWSEKGDYEIRAKAKDTKGLESDWGYLTVTVPKNQQSQSESSSSIKIIQAVKTTTKITSR